MAIHLTPTSITAGSVEGWSYLATYADLQAAFHFDDVLAAGHYNTTGGPVEHRAITFDAWEYEASNTDLVRYFGTDVAGAAQHYVIAGRAEGRQTTSFDGAAYLAANADLRLAFGGDADGGVERAIQHYVLAGYSEIVNGLRPATGTPLANSQTFTLTGGADIIPGLIGSHGNIGNSGDNLIVATESTLSSADAINGGAGNDHLKLSSQTTHTYGAFEMASVETVTVTSDLGTTQTLDLSGSTGVNTLETLNSTGNVIWNYATGLADLSVTNITNNANVGLFFQGTVVAGSNDTVHVNLNSNANANAGVITIGQIDGLGVAANTGIETVDVIVSGSNHVVGQLNTQLSSLLIHGDHDLIITAPLLGTETVIDANTFTGNLNLNSTLTGGSAVTFTGGHGADTVTFAGTTGDHTITTGDGNDNITLGFGHDTVDLGAGNDTLNIVPNVLTVDDTINGGAGADTIVLTGSDNISLSEAERVTAVEKLVLKGSGVNYDGALNRFWLGLGSNIVVADHLLTTLSPGSDRFIVDTQSYTGSNTVDITNVTFTYTNKFELDASSTVANNELVIANDATVNAKAILHFGAGLGDTLRVLDGASITSDDLSNISGLERIELQAKSIGNQLWDIEVSDALVNQSTSHAGVDIWIDNDVPAGSIVRIDASNLTIAGIRVHTNSNVTLQVTGAGAANVTSINSRYFTSTGDALVGTAAADTFVADNLGQVQNGDSALGLGAVDTFLLNFAVYNEAIPLFGAGNSLNNITLTSVENIVFNANRLTATDHPVAFIDNANAGIVTGVQSYTTGDGNDIIHGNINGSDISYNLGAGNNNYYDPVSAGHAAITETVTTLGGADHVHFGANGWSSLDAISLGLGSDQISVDLSGGLNVSGWNHVSGVDIINVNSSVGANVFTLDNAIVTQADSGNHLVINATDHAGGISVDAAAVTVPNSVTINIISDTTALHNTSQGADFAGGAGNDTFNVTANGAVDGIIIRGNGGADTINLGADTIGGPHDTQYIEFATGNDGAAQGANTGYDVINGFQGIHSPIPGGQDFVQIAAGEGLVHVVDSNNNGSIQWITDGPIIFTANGVAGGTGEALLLTHGATALTNADLIASGFTNVLERINVDVTYNGINPGGLVVAQGESDTAVYFIADQDHNGYTNPFDVKLLGVFHNVQLAPADFTIA